MTAKPSRRRSVALLLSLITAALVHLAGMQAAHADKSRWGEGYLPNVELLTADGRAVRFYDDLVKGRVVVFSFIYTSCRDICPLVTARLAEVYEQLGPAAGKDIRFVSISIDPDNDTPARLQQHAAAFRSDPAWVFVTGRPENIKLVRHKLGERSRKLTEHSAQIMLYNDMTGDWSRDSAFADLGALKLSILSMVPEWRASAGLAGVVSSETEGAAPVELPGQALFAKACATCHTVGKGRRIGPDLAGVTARRERDWLQRFIRAPAAMHAAEDPIAVQLAAEFPAVRMPNLQLSVADVSDVLTYLDARTFAVAAADDELSAAHARSHQHGSHGAAGHDSGQSRHPSAPTPDHKHQHGHHEHGHDHRH